ncbi:Clp protease N-terminal domain-containing protein [Actinoplanes sp. RD1]|uniref:Clp protease N-terminal domain-containing protein n=1 Tax=Actinoplanes sp. RD1 TaxID=3064538 RepID=UPI00274147B3|nr:Clp protease N-terminal domain-containing protein [Actinoplanes sp. RD1]
MLNEFTGDARTNDAVGAARAHSGNPEGPAVIGTHHLLVGLASAKSGARERLEAAGLTRTVLVTLLRTGFSARSEGAAVPVRFPEIGKTEQVSEAAAAALERYLADGRPEPETLLAAVLGDADSLAVQMVRECGVDVDLRPARVPARLEAVRDHLIGRTKYRNPGLRNLSLAIAVATRPNWARTPVLWAKLEAERTAARPRTDDLLVALLTTYEVARAYPHLLAEAEAGEYDGARALAGAGLDAGTLVEAARTRDLGSDAVEVKTLLKYGRNWPSGTAELLSRLLAHEDNRSVRLLRALGVDVSTLASATRR